MRLNRITTMLAGTVLCGSLALANHNSHLDSAEDRAAFRRWFTFLAESRYYAHKPLREIQDGESLIRWAFRNALAPHSTLWSRTLELPVYPAMPSVLNLSSDGADYHLRFISLDVSAAQPGDLLLYDKEHLPAYVMVYIGSSQVIPSSCRWVIYLASGRVHKVEVVTLLNTASPEFQGVWRLAILRDAE